MLHYQPKVNLQTGAITGVEALLRWRHPIRRLIRPSRFISIAEHTGLIVPIGKWVLREACRQAKAWQDAGLDAVSVAINISPVELRAKGFLAGVKAALAETRLEAQHLELEITETFLLQDAPTTRMILEELSAMGVKLALDDFGTGYSSLSYLQRLPIDTREGRPFIHSRSHHRHGGCKHRERHHRDGPESSHARGGGGR